MTKNYMQDVARMLGVELEEEFELNESNAIYKLSQYGFFFKCGDSWMRVSDYLLIDIIKGVHTIKKLLWKPKVGDVYYRPRDYHAAFSEAVTDFWRDTVNDFALKEAGMIFRTEEECKAALPELRKKYLGGGCNETDD